MKAVHIRSFKKTTFALMVVLVCLFIQGTGWALEASFSNSLGMEFALIPAGTFIMGSPKNEKGRGTSEAQHKVTISRPFYIQTTEVTVGQWEKVMGRRLLNFRRTPDLPIVKISWHDAMKYIDRMNALGEGTYRLPTDAEWEYAARAKTTTTFSWGSKIDCTHAMYSNNQSKSDICVDYVRSKGLKPDRPAPVKSYPPNAWGLYDMHGNAWEWCQDGFDPDKHGSDPHPTYELVDPVISRSAGNRIRRGGSWFGKGGSCRSANRTYSHPSVRYRTTGFRLVREVQ